MEPRCTGVGCVALSLSVVFGAGMDRRHGHLTGRSRVESVLDQDSPDKRRVEVVWEDGAVRWPVVGVVVPHSHCVIENQDILKKVGILV